MKILVVDDDKIIREDIRNLIDWKSNHFELAGEAANGFEALEFLKSNKADIIITDIYMPILNGVELIKEVKDKYGDIQILVISNYDDFAYVKDAMKYGALDYIMKYKLNENSLVALLKAAAAEVEKAKKVRCEKEQSKKALLWEREQEYKLIWRDFLDGSSSFEQAADKCLELNMEFPKGEYVLFLLQSENPEKLSSQDICSVFEDTSFHRIQTGTDESLFLVHFHQKSLLYMHSKTFEMVHKLSKALQGHRTVLSHSTEAVSCKLIPQAVNKLRNLSKLYFYHETDGFFAVSGENTFNCSMDINYIEETENQILESIKNCQGNQFRELLQTFVNEVKSRNYSPELVINELKVMIQFIKKIIRCSYYYKTDILQSLDLLLSELDRKFATLRHIEGSLLNIVQKYFERFDNEEINAFRAEINKAVKYIRENYKKNITLTELSEYVGISKNHFCMLFKQETGESFKEYLNRLRINEAKILISEKNFYIKEVANEVGINNQRYFCKLFKEYTGSNPTHYKIRR